ncbi:hypothetical protein [Vulcanisaeta sp. JCM 16159]|uniref:hypothetical protein n=1 Tax=Vulcanisaeta sp. JCM 16159 TaxID=1295371 RepID=UPI001FB4C0A9|nr:hypothetical protein [Vulcanisaeta sp. JCM 16159]
MRCITLSLREIGALEVCVYGDKIREVKVRVGADGAERSITNSIVETIMKYITGLIGPQEIIKHVELSPGLLAGSDRHALNIERQGCNLCPTCQVIKHQPQGRW